MKEVYAQCESKRESCMLEQKKLSQKLSNLVAGNRELKGQLLEAERFKDLVEKAMARIKALEQSIETMEKDIVDTRYICTLQGRRQAWKSGGGGLMCPEYIYG